MNFQNRTSVPHKTQTLLVRSLMLMLTLCISTITYLLLSTDGVQLLLSNTLDTKSFSITEKTISGNLLQGFSIDHIKVNQQNIPIKVHGQMNLLTPSPHITINLYSNIVNTDHINFNGKMSSKESNHLIEQIKHITHLTSQSHMQLTIELLTKKIKLKINSNEETEEIIIDHTHKKPEHFLKNHIYIWKDMQNIYHIDSTNNKQSIIEISGKINFAKNPYIMIDGENAHFKFNAQYHPSENEFGHFKITSKADRHNNHIEIKRQMNQTLENWFIELMIDKWEEKSTAVSNMKLSIERSIDADSKQPQRLLLKTSAENISINDLTINDLTLSYDEKEHTSIAFHTDIKYQNNIWQVHLIPQKKEHFLTIGKKNNTSPTADPFFKIHMETLSSNALIDLKLYNATLNGSHFFIEKKNDKRLTIDQKEIKLTSFSKKNIEQLQKTFDVNFSFKNIDQYDADLVFNNFNCEDFMHIFALTTPIEINKIQMKGQVKINKKAHENIKLQGRAVLNHLEMSFNTERILPSTFENPPKPIPFVSDQLSITLDENDIKVYGFINTNHQQNNANTEQKNIELIELKIECHHEMFQSSHTPTTHISIQGENIHLFNQEEIKILIDTHIETNNQNNGIWETKGHIDIKQNSIFKYQQHHQTPWKINQEINIHDQKATLYEKKKNQIQNENHALELTISFDDSQIQLLDIHGKLNGGILLKHLPSQQLLATGKLVLTEANFDFFRHKVPIDTFEVSWFEKSLDTPSLEILFSKNISLSNRKLQTYGLKITGNSQLPNIEFFSSPNQMTEYEILSGILQPNSKENLDHSAPLPKIINLIEDQKDTEELIQSIKTLTHLKKIISFDYIEDNKQSKNNNTQDSINFINDLEYTLTRKLKENMTLQVKIPPNHPELSKVLIELGIEKNFSVSTSIDSYGRAGLACHIKTDD